MKAVAGAGAGGAAAPALTELDIICNKIKGQHLEDTLLSCLGQVGLYMNGRKKISAEIRFLSA